MAVLAPGIFAPFMLFISAVRAKSARERLARRAPDRPSYFWGFFLGNASVIGSVSVLFFTVPITGVGLLEPGTPVGTAAIVASVWALAQFSAGIFTLGRNRWGLTAATALTAFPPVWIVYGVYIAKRWNELADPLPVGDDTDA